MIRPFTIRDWPWLRRYRDDALFPDSQPALLWGRGIVTWGAMLSPFSSLTGLFTSLSKNSTSRFPFIGQAQHHLGSSYAHLTFLAPDRHYDSPALAGLLEHLLAQIGARGAHSLVAEVEEASPAFAALQEASFSIYARQRIWRLNHSSGSPANHWRPATELDGLAVHLLCDRLVPGLVQQVEPAPGDPLSGYVLLKDGELVAYAEVRRGLRGIWLQPFVDADGGLNDEEFASLVALLRPSRRSPLYICLRSYQDRLETLLRALEAEPGPRQAVMVKRTARPLKVPEKPLFAHAERGRTEPTTPIHVPTPMIRRETELVAYDPKTNH